MTRAFQNTIMKFIFIKYLLSQLWDSKVTIFSISIKP